MPADSITKMKIEAYSKNDFSGKSGEMEVQFNPASIVLGWGSGAGEGKDKKKGSQQIAGGDYKNVKLTGFKPGSVTFDLIFDSTLLIDGKRGKAAWKQIQTLHNVCINVNSKSHAPNYLKLTWGEFQLKGIMSSLSVTYELFESDGTPLRAKATCGFIRFTDALTKAKKEGKQSPDMTQVFTIKEGDTLPLLCFEHYGSSRYYMQVAKFNNLPYLSCLRPGQKIVLPPLVDTLPNAEAN